MTYKPGVSLRTSALRGVATAVLGLAGLLGCAGCWPQVRQPTTPVTPPAAFSATGTSPLPARWWTAFGDPHLNKLVAEALSGNLSLRATWDRLAQTRAEADRRLAARLPAVDASAAFSRSVTKTADRPRAYTDSRALGLAASYEVDLWGRVRSAHAAAELDAQASAEDLHAAAMTLAAEIAGTWYRLTELHGQLKLLAGQVKTNQDYLAIVTAKFQKGQAPATDVLQQRQLLESTRAERLLVASEIEVARHQLALLVGRSPGTFTPPATGELPAIAELPATGVPTAWLQQRPDLRAAYLRVQAADHRVAAAIADRFPRLGLSARADTTAPDIRDLFDNWLATLAANLSAPLFDAGQRQAEVARTRAVASERLNAYGQVVLTSLKEVEEARKEYEGDSAIQNIIDGIVDLYLSTLYKLKFLA